MPGLPLLPSPDARAGAMALHAELQVMEQLLLLLDAGTKGLLPGQQGRMLPELVTHCGWGGVAVLGVDVHRGQLDQLLEDGDHLVLAKPAVVAIAIARSHWGRGQGDELGCMGRDGAQAGPTYCFMVEEDEVPLGR